jgi:hypothetical protein
MGDGNVAIHQEYSKTNQITGQDTSITRFIAPCIRLVFNLYIGLIRPAEALLITKIHHADNAASTAAFQRYSTFLFVSNGQVMTHGEIRRIFENTFQKYTGVSLTFGQWRHVVS